MSNLVTVNSGSAIDGTLKAGRIAIATSASIDPSDFYEMVNPAGGYVFITDPKIQGYNDGPPQIYQSPTNLPADVLATINGLPDRVGSEPFDNVWDALSWVGHSKKYFILDKSPTRLFAGESELVIDGASLSTYPQSGSTAFDLSGNDRNGTLVNGVSWNENGYFEFDGTDDRIDFTEFQLTGDWTISYFYYHDESSQNSMPLGTKDDNNSRFYHRDTGTSYRLRVHNAAGNNVGDLVIGNINGSGRQKWGHIAYSMTSTHKYGWVNGQNNLSSTHSLPTTFDFNCIGDGYDSSEVYHWDGNLTQVVINNKKLTDQEVNQLYHGANIVTNGLVFATDPGNLVSYDKEGTILYSLTGSNSGSIINGVEYNKDFGGSFYFDGTNDYIDTNYSLNGSNAFSVSCWFKLDRVDKNWQSVVDAYLNSTDRNFQLWVNNNAKLYVFHLGASHSGAGQLFPNVWYNAVFTYEGSGNGVLYLNGEVLEASVPKGAGSGGNVNVDIGRRTDAHASSYTDGNISTVKIYDKALTATEVSQNYNAEYSRFISSRDITKEDLVLELDAHNPDSYLSGTTWTDVSGKGNDGTLYNGPTYLTDRGGVINFDNTDDYIHLNNDLGYSTDSVSVFAWYKINGNPAGNYHIICGGQELEMSINVSHNYLRNGVLTNNGRFVSNDGNISLNDGNYHFYGFTFDGSTKRAYIDGVQVGTQAVTGTLATSFSNRRLGRFGSSGTYYANGNMGYYAVWDKVLSADEIMRQYTTMRPQYSVSLPRTVTDSLKLNLDAGDITSYSRTGTTWYDRSGNGNNATLYNSPTYTIAEGGVFDLDGTDDYFIAPASAGGMYNFGANGTLEMWFRPDASFTTNHRLLCVTNNASAIDVYIASSGTLYLHGNKAYASSNTIPINEWTHLMVTYIGGTVQIYFNGEAQTMAGTQLTGYNITNNNQLFIGQFSGGGSYYFNGKIANTKIYHRGLTPSEVLENYKATRSRFGVDGIVTSNLQILYDFSNPDSFDNSSTTVTDLQGTQNGTLVNGIPFRSNNGGVVAFDGSNDYVDAGNPNYSDYTILMWFKIDTPQTTFTTVGHRTFVGCSNFRFQWDDDNTTQARGPFIDFTSGGGSLSGTTFSPEQWFNKWQQVGVSRTSGAVKVYWNGQSVNSSSITGQNLTDFEIGYDRLSGIGGGDPINRDGGEVQLGHFMVYNDVLTDAEVLQNYNALKNRFGKD